MGRNESDESRPRNVQTQSQFTKLHWSNITSHIKHPPGNTSPRGHVHTWWGSLVHVYVDYLKGILPSQIVEQLWVDIRSRYFVLEIVSQRGGGWWWWIYLDNLSDSEAKSIRIPKFVSRSRRGRHCYCGTELTCKYWLSTRHRGSHHRARAGDAAANDNKQQLLREQETWHRHRVKNYH